MNLVEKFIFTDDMDKEIEFLNEFRDFDILVSCKIIDEILQNHIDISHLKFMCLSESQNLRDNDHLILEHYLKIENSVKINKYKYSKLSSNFPMKNCVEWLSFFIRYYSFVTIILPKTSIPIDEIQKIYNEDKIVSIERLSEISDYFIIWWDQDSILRVYKNLDNFSNSTN